MDNLNKVALGSREKALFKNLLIGFNNCGRQAKRHKKVEGRWNTWTHEQKSPEIQMVLNIVGMKKVPSGESFNVETDNRSLFQV